MLLVVLECPREDLNFTISPWRWEKPPQSFQNYLLSVELHFGSRHWMQFTAKWG